MPEQFNLYLIINFIALAGPFFLSFDKKVAFYKHWGKLLFSLIFLWTIYLPWDIFFTATDQWGFNPDYLIGIEFAFLPVEEWMFFLIIPYCFLFIYECVKAYFPSTTSKTEMPYYLLLGIAVSQTIHGGIYSYMNLIVILFGFLITRNSLTKAFWISYAITLFPFLIFNGILTGSITPSPVVWYNQAAFSGVRVGTIPSEDFIYLLGMMLLCIKGWYWMEKK
ncbi:lycopene cyclase domain-containing protein [Flammeovirga sp. MY04]|uniref:lycopene cyclase domain-containing protein n=1 Tax=Flammeovirga sp. MY04 TaxID=1191459 RepID=UPI0008060987|nr:lycopene cyclase domain-containing protein [Flammeovirga sp. MY04]ANQ48886.1 lycopene cyclase domain-containing protein [Flammeovirga sp. MY04]